MLSARFVSEFVESAQEDVVFVAPPSVLLF